MRPCPTLMRALPAALALIGLLPHLSLIHI